MSITNMKTKDTLGFTISNDRYENLISANKELIEMYESLLMCVKKYNFVDKVNQDLNLKYGNDRISAIKNDFK
jgi:hypothetical protein